MKAIALEQPRSVEEAVAALAEHGDDATVVAGSTAVTILLRQRLLDPDVLVLLHRIEGLRDIRVQDGALVLDALVTHREVERSPLVRRLLPVLARSFAVIGNVRVRTVATVGGVLAEADYASDPPCVLRALDAEVVARGPDGERTIAIEDFLVGFYETALEPGELVTGVRVPLPSPGTAAVYEKFRTRSSEDRPCVGTVAAVRLDGGGRCAELRVAVGAASETPERHRDVEAAALGRPLDEGLATEIADAYADRIEPLDDMRGSAWYRREMVRVWVRRAILEAASRGSSAPIA